jgi:phosphate/sulfate permease
LRAPGKLKPSPGSQRPIAFAVYGSQSIAGKHRKSVKTGWPRLDAAASRVHRLYVLRIQSLRKLLRLPLIFSAALLSFAHGANDVANAAGPLAAIVHTAEIGEVAPKVSIPLWVMAVGAAGISVGLLLFGPKLIRMVGNQITKLNPMRAYCVALSAAVTVILASWLELPVSSTHITVGAVFRGGFLPRMVHRKIEPQG